MLVALVLAELADDAVQLVLLDGFAFLGPPAEDHHGAAFRVYQAQEAAAESVPPAAAAGDGIRGEKTRGWRRCVREAARGGAERFPQPPG